MKRPVVVAVAVAGVSLFAVGCQKGGGASSDPAASASGAPPPLDTSWERDPGHVLAAGERAPNFEGVAHTGMRVRLSSFLEKPVIVYFYTDDRSPDALAAARSFRDEWMKLIEGASMVIGVSADDRITHRELATGEKLPFLLVADERNAIARAFGVPIDSGRNRAVTFVVGKDGVIARVLDAIPPEGQAPAVLKSLEVLP